MNDQDERIVPGGGVQPDRVLRFAPNRVWRCYTGGALLETFLGQAAAGDGYFPEEWLASTTRAMNGAHSQGPTEGLSRIRIGEGLTGPLLADAIATDPAGFLGPEAAADGDGLGVLCKFLDSSVRLPIQCHPDRAFAKTHYHSSHGKTEAWIILGGRAINGEPPYLLMGFKPGVDKARFRRAVEAQDIPAMEAMLHRVAVQRGDVWFIPGRLPHAIGPGVFMLEVQEPSDWVIQPERFCAGTRLSDADMWGPLPPDTAFDCFAYGGEPLADLRRRLLLQPALLQEEAGGRLEAVIGPDTTDCFSVNRLAVRGTFRLKAVPQASIGIVTAGAGELVAASGRYAVRQGDVVLLPARLGDADCVAAGALEMYVVAAGRRARPSDSKRL